MVALADRRLGLDGKSFVAMNERQYWFVVVRPVTSQSHESLLQIIIIAALSFTLPLKESMTTGTFSHFD